MLMTLSKLKSEPGELAGEVQPARKIRLGWFSSWNTRCGMAEYSKYLLGEIDAKRFEWTVLASYTEENIRDDAAHVIRCWTNNVGSANALLAVVLKERFDVLVIQFNFGFLSLHHLEALIACCHCVGTRVVMIFHATVYVDPAGNAVSLPHSLATVDRLLVHSQADLERLQTFGLKDNVELFPHGYVDYGFFDRMACRQLLQLPPDDLIPTRAARNPSPARCALELHLAAQSCALRCRFFPTCPRSCTFCAVFARKTFVRTCRDFCRTKRDASV
jgi:hypothetical protein